MIFKITILLHILFILMASAEDISTRLANGNYKERKAALQEAKKLPVKEMRELIKKLKESKDPELTESAKELSALLPEAFSSEQLIKLIEQNKFLEFKNAFKLNKDLLKKTKKGYNLLDYAYMHNKDKIIHFLKESGLKSKLDNLQTIDVLVVESDTYESLANDFMSEAILIRYINKNVKLEQGMILKVPYKN
jgi:hypothetical protein